MTEKMKSTLLKLQGLWSKVQAWVDKYYNKLPLEKINRKLNGKIDVTSRKFKLIAGYSLLGFLCVFFICLLSGICFSIDKQHQNELKLERQKAVEEQFANLQKEQLKSVAEFYRKEMDYAKLQQQQRMEEAQAKLDLTRKKRELELKNLEEEQQEKKREAAKLKEEEEQKKAEQRRVEEEKRKAEEARLAEQRRVEEEKRKAEEARLAEQRRAAEARLAEQRRIEEEKRKAEEARLAEQRRVEEEKRKAEEARLAEQRRAEEEKRVAEQKKRQERQSYKMNLTKVERITYSEKKELVELKKDPQKAIEQFFSKSIPMQRYLVANKIIDAQKLLTVQDGKTSALENGWKTFLDKIREIAVKNRGGDNKQISFADLLRSGAGQAGSYNQCSFPTREVIFQVILLIDMAKNGVKFSAIPRLKISEIHAAVLNNDIAKVEELLKKKPYLINSKDVLDRTPLFYAWTVEMTNVLAAHNAAVNVSDAINIPLYQYVFAHANTDLLACYLTPSFADPTVQKRFQYVHKDIVFEIESHKVVNRNRKQYIGANMYMPLFYKHIAAFNHDKDAVKMLLNKYPPAYSRDSYCNDCVHAMFPTAFAAKSWDVILTMIELGVIPPYSDTDDAVETGNCELVKYLLSLDFISGSGRGYTIALENNDMEMFDVLLQAKITPANKALVLAIKKGNLRAVEQLLAVNVFTSKETLILAVESGNLDIVKVLVEVGLQVDAEVIKKAREKNNKEIIDYLESFLLE